MPAPLSIIVPVHNAQASLHDTVVSMVEWLGEMHSPFELLLVDNGSTDATAEIAHDLEVHFPQVRFIRQSARTGRAAALRAGIERARGEVLLLGSERWMPEPYDVLKLWKLMADNEAASARPQPARRAVSADKASREVQVLMLSRGLLFELLATRAGWLEELEAEESKNALPVLLDGTHRGGRPAIEALGRLAGNVAARSQPAPRPNYLTRLKQFALGE